MRKCTKCFDDKTEEKEAELWQNMIDSLMHFTQTSTELMKGMQHKLGIPPDSDPDQKMCDPCGLLEKITEELGDMEAQEKVSNMCTCTSPSQLFDDDVEITAGIECYKETRIIRKKKFKYSSDIENRLLARKKKGPAPTCRCNTESSKLGVDACLCKHLPNGIEIRSHCDEEFCPIRFCSDLALEEIENVHCVGEMIGEKGGDKTDPDDPLAWIPKPGSFDPDKLPQDDNHPYVIKIQDDLQAENNSSGFELCKAMKKFADNIAQIDYSTGELETYSEYHKKCVLVAQRLKRQFSPTDIVGICTDNHRNCYVPYIAGLFNGNRVVAFDRSAEKKQMTNFLENVTPSVMFISDSCLTFLQECMQAAKVDFKIVLFGDGDDVGFERFSSYLEDKRNSVDASTYDAENTDNVDSTCLICFNGGVPEYKAVCLSHYGMLKQSLRMISTQHAQPVTLSFLDTFQISSLLVLFSSILDGATRIIVEEFEGENLWKTVEKYEINAVHLHPHHLLKLSILPEPEEDTSSLFYIFTGGSKLRVDALEKLKKVLLKTLICQTYEHTELSGFITLFDFSKPENGIFNYFVNLSCGRPVGEVWYKVIDAKTGKMVHQLTHGELFVKSKLMRNGYLIANKEKTYSKDEWISTGDLVYYDTYRCFHIVDRISDLIKYKNNLIIPSKIEDILLTHPMITAAVVVPVPDKEDGQHAAAVVSVKENEDIYTKDIEEWMKSRVPEEEQLRGGVRIVGDIPCTKSGRINRRMVAAMAR